MNMLVSIVTPSYNQADYIKQTILSVRNQSYRPIEHIIVDGCSTDGTVEILRTDRPKADDIKLIWISEKDNGQANAINKGLKLAQGEIIGWLNSDDVYFYTDVIERIVKEFAENPDIDIIHGDVAKIGEDNLIRFVWCIPEFNYGRMYVDGKVSQPTVFFRKKIFNDHALRENFLALDYELWLRLGRLYKFKHLNVILAGDREQPNRISARKKLELQKSHELARDEYFPNPSISKVFWYRISSFPYRFLLRLKGLIQLIALITKRPWREKLAFDGYIDNKGQVIYRQLFQRVGKP
jgi:glycosyltransferase involved in cell wall biosynthesis